MRYTIFTNYLTRDLESNQIAESSILDTSGERLVEDLASLITELTEGEIQTEILSITVNLSTRQAVSLT